MKKLKLMLIGFISVFLMVISVSQANAYEMKNSNIKVSDMFVEFIDDIFSNKDKTTVWNTENVDITEQFFYDLQSYYNIRDYASIKTYTIDHNVAEMSLDESTIENFKYRSPFVHQLVNKRFFKTVNKEQASGEVEYFLRSSFVWDRATYKITSVGDVTIDITKQNFGNNWTTEISSMSASSQLSSDKYEVTFKGSFNMRAIYSQYNQVVWNINLGQFTASTTEHPDTFQ